MDSRMTSAGQFSNVWATQLAKFNTGSAFPAVRPPARRGDSLGTLVGFVVPSNYDQTYGLTVTVWSVRRPGKQQQDTASRNALRITLLRAWAWPGSRSAIDSSSAPAMASFYDRIYGNL